jgi:hypothetical protein
MPVTQTMCTSFKGEVLLGVHDFRATGGDTFKIALYTSAANIGAETTAYTTDNEVTGSGYTAGGATLVNLGVSTSDMQLGASQGTGFTSFATASFPASFITAAGAIIYNTTPSANGANNTALVNPAVCVLDFGGDKTSANNSFIITFPINSGGTAIVRIS